MNVSLEYGQGTIDVTLPDNSDIFIPGETVADPPYIPEDKIYEETLNAIRNPLGMDPLTKMANPDSKVTIIFPDRVKGGEQATSHRKVAIKLVLDELYSVGVKKENILLICSNGLHRKNTEQEIRGVLGNDLYNQFAPSGQIINHDSEDWDHLVDLGTTEAGDPVIMNKYVYDSDLAIMIGHTQGNPYGGYSGGYKHSATGISHWRSIASHHVPKVMHRDDFTPVNSKSLMRNKFDAISMHMEKCMGKKFFCVDAVLDTKSRQIAVLAGAPEVMQPESWKIADKRTYVPWAKKKYNVLVFGLPQFFHYGDGMGTNPIMLMQAISAQIVRHKRVLADNCVVICTSICNGFLNEDLWPYLTPLYDLFQRNEMQTLPDLNRYGEYYATNEEYIRQYRYTNAFHPFHGFSMISSAHIAEKNTAAIYLCGAKVPGYARGMGLKTRETVEDALAHAMKTIVGSDPNILVLPRTFKCSAVHLMMEGDDPNVSSK